MKTKILEGCYKPPQFDHCIVNFEDDPPSFFVETILDPDRALEKLAQLFPLWKFKVTYKSEHPGVYGYHRFIRGEYVGP